MRRPNSLEMGRSYLRGQIDCTHRTRPAGNAFRSGQFHRTCCTGGMGSRMLCSSYVCSNCRRNIVCRDNWLLCALVVRISCKACLDNRRCQSASLCPCCSHKLQMVHSRAECPTVLQRGQIRLRHALLLRWWPTSLHTVQYLGQS